MADWVLRSTGAPVGIDADVEITGAATITGALTQTGAVTVAGDITASTGFARTMNAIAANGTIGNAGYYIFNGADAAIHMPPISGYDGKTIVIACINGTGTATLNDDATDSAALIVSGATGAAFALTPNVVCSLTAYEAGTCWVGVS